VAGLGLDIFPTNATDGLRCSLIHTMLDPDGQIARHARPETVPRTPHDFRKFDLDREALPIHAESFSRDMKNLQLVASWQD